MTSFDGRIGRSHRGIVRITERDKLPGGGMAETTVSFSGTTDLAYLPVNNRQARDDLAYTCRLNGVLCEPVEFDGGAGPDEHYNGKGRDKVGAPIPTCWRLLGSIDGIRAVANRPLNAREPNGARLVRLEHVGRASLPFRPMGMGTLGLGAKRRLSQAKQEAIGKAEDRALAGRRERDGETREDAEVRAAAASLGITRACDISKLAELLRLRRECGAEPSPRMRQLRAELGLL